MKKILSLLLLFACFAASAQMPPLYQKIGPKYSWTGGQFIEELVIPSNLKTLACADTNRVAVYNGKAYYSKRDSITGCAVWALWTGTGGGGGSDGAIYFANGDKARLTGMDSSARDAGGNVTIFRAYGTDLPLAYKDTTGLDNTRWLIGQYIADNTSTVDANSGLMYDAGAVKLNDDVTQRIAYNAAWHFDPGKYFSIYGDNLGTEMRFGDNGVLFSPATGPGGLFEFNVGPTDSYTRILGKLALGDEWTSDDDYDATLLGGWLPYVQLTASITADRDFITGDGTLNGQIFTVVSTKSNTPYKWNLSGSTYKMLDGTTLTFLEDLKTYHFTWSTVDGCWYAETSGIGSVDDIPDATPLVRGLMSTGTQTFGGQKEFNDLVLMNTLVIGSVGGEIFNNSSKGFSIGTEAYSGNRPSLSSGGTKYLRYSNDDFRLEMGNADDPDGSWRQVAFLDDITGGSGMTNPMTTAGDIITGGSSGTPQRLGIGSTGQVLTVSGGAPVWSALPSSFVQDGNSFGAAATIGTNDGNALNIETNNVARATFSSGGNYFFNGTGSETFVIGATSTSNTEKFQVVGTARATQFMVKNAGSSASVYPFRIEASGSTTEVARFAETGNLMWGANTNTLLSSSVIKFGTNGVTYNNTTTAGTAVTTHNFISSASYTYTSGTGATVAATSGYTVSTGTGIFRSFVGNPTINQTGSATGAIIGFSWEPTKTSLVGDEISFNAASGRTAFAGFGAGLAAKTGAYTATTSDNVIAADATGGAFNVTLPTAVGKLGIRYTVIKTDASANAVTIATTSSQNINGATTYALSAQYKYAEVVSDNAKWLIIANN